MLLHAGSGVAGIHRASRASLNFQTRRCPGVGLLVPGAWAGYDRRAIQFGEALRAWSRGEDWFGSCDGHRPALPRAPRSGDSSAKRPRRDRLPARLVVSGRRRHLLRPAAPGIPRSEPFSPVSGLEYLERHIAPSAVGLDDRARGWRVYRKNLVREHGGGEKTHSRCARPQDEEGARARHRSSSERARPAIRPHQRSISSRTADRHAPRPAPTASSGRGDEALSVEAGQHANPQGRA